MALINFGPTVSALSGSIGGVVFARNAGGAFARNRSIPTDPATVQQQVARNALRIATQYWQEDTSQAQRDAWNAYAAAVPMVNRLGNELILNGQQMFIRTNALRVRVGLDIIADGPTTFNLGNLGTGLAIVGDAVSTEMAVTFDDTLDWVDQDGSAMVIQTSAERSPTRNATNGPFQFASTLLGDSVAPLSTGVSVENWYTHAIVGNVFIARARVTFADGRLTEPVLVRCPIEA